MILIIAVVALAALKFFEIGFFGGISWLWVVGLAVVAFVWFEFIERMFGLDKKKEFNEQEKAKKERVRKAFEKK